MKSQRQRETPELPMDLMMVEIFTKLPAKSLMRFKCVSKLWASCITSQCFINCFLKIPSTRLYLCLEDINTHRNCVTLSFAPETASSSSFVIDHDMTIPHIGCNLSQYVFGFMCYSFYGKFLVHNPATRQLVALPNIKPEIKIVYPKRETVNFKYFGHDPVNNQYKVVCSVGVYPTRSLVLRSEHWIFYLQPEGGSWRNVVAPTQPDFCPYIPLDGGVCIDGVIYYLGWIDKLNFVLVSFQINSEEVKTIKVPLTRDKNVCVIEYGGKLTISDQTKLKDNGMLDLWILEDAENQTWSKKTLVLKPCQLHLVNDIIFNVKRTTQTGKLLLVPKRLFSPFHVLTYDMQSNELRKIEIKGIPKDWYRRHTTYFDVVLMDQSESIMSLPLRRLDELDLNVDDRHNARCCVM